MIARRLELPRALRFKTYQEIDKRPRDEISAEIRHCIGNLWELAVTAQPEHSNETAVTFNNYLIICYSLVKKIKIKVLTSRVRG